MNVIAVIPAYNESSTIVDVVNRTLAKLDQVIVVDDASTDGTADGLHDKSVTLLRNEENLGKGGVCGEVSRQRYRWVPMP